MADMDFTAADSALLVIDVQERFAAAIPSIAADAPVGRACRILAESAAILAVRSVCTEQYPKGLGSTLPHLAAHLPPALPKTHFSCCGDPAALAAIDAAKARTWVLCGIEAHVCVLATAADLLARGHRVILAGDAVDSRSAGNRAMALEAARDLGALVVPVESIVFRWLREARGDAFKRVSALVR
jgi:nicotinamidase-related amidase